MTGLTVFARTGSVDVAFSLKMFFAFMSPLILLGLWLLFCRLFRKNGSSTKDAVPEKTPEGNNVEVGKIIRGAIAAIGSTVADVRSSFVGWVERKRQTLKDRRAQREQERNRRREEERAKKEAERKERLRQEKEKERVRQEQERLEEEKRKRMIEEDRRRVAEIEKAMEEEEAQKEVEMQEKKPNNSLEADVAEIKRMLAEENEDHVGADFLLGLLLGPFGVICAAIIGKRKGCYNAICGLIVLSLAVGIISLIVSSCSQASSGSYRGY